MTEQNFSSRLPPAPLISNGSGLPRKCFEITAMTADAIGYPGDMSADMNVRLLREIFLNTLGSKVDISYPQVQLSEIRNVICEQAEDQFSVVEVEQLVDVVARIEYVLGRSRGGERQDIPGIGSFEVIWMVSIASYLSYLIGDYDERS